MSQREILAAYQQGKRDALAGRNRLAVRYKDRAKCEAWERGLLDALKSNPHMKPRGVNPLAPRKEGR